jgi:tetratricopeptide (TPR) repeat protein
MQKFWAIIVFMDSKIQLRHAEIDGMPRFPMRWWRHTCLLGCILALLCTAQAANIDSLKHVVAEGRLDTNTVNAGYSIAFHTRYDNSDIALQYALNSMAMSRKLDFEVGIARGYQNVGQCYLSAGRLDTALEYFKDGALYAIEIGYRRGLYLSCLHAGTAYEMKGDYSSSVKAQMWALKMAIEDGDESNITDCEYNLGITYFRVGEYSVSLAYFTKAAERYRDRGDSLSYSAALEAIGNVAIEQGDYDLALTNCRQAIDLILPYGETGNLAPSYLNLGSIYFFKRDFPNAVHYMQMALDIAIETHQQGIEADCHNNLGNCYHRMGNLALAETHSLKAMELCRLTNRGETLLDAMGNLVQVYEEQGKAEMALKYYRELRDLKESLRVDEAAAEITNLRVEFEGKKNAQEILLLQEQKNASEIKAEKAELRVVASVAIAIACAVVVVLMVLFQRMRKRAIALEIAQKNTDFAHKKIELEQRALRAQMNPHFIFNSLNAIQRLYIEGDLDRAGDYMSDFAQILRKILDHSSCDKITLSDELETLRLYMSLEGARLESLLEYELHIDEEIDIYNTWVAPLILQPFVENAIWHGILPTGKKGTVMVHLRPDESVGEGDFIYCNIIDDGVGIDTSRSTKVGSAFHESKGIRITQDRLGISGVIIAEQMPTGGTKITLKIPVTYQ